MSFNTFGKIFRFTTWGESHGPAIGCVVDGCPPNINIKEEILTDIIKYQKVRLHDPNTTYPISEKFLYNIHDLIENNKTMLTIKFIFEKTVSLKLIPFSGSFSSNF